MEQALSRARVDQIFVRSLVLGGFGGTELAAVLAEPLLAQLQRTEPVDAAWQPLVLQALRDPRQQWEPAYLMDRARLLSHVRAHPSPLLVTLCEQLHRPWDLSLRHWRQRLGAYRSSGSGGGAALQACLVDLRRGQRGIRRDDALRAVCAQWHGWAGSAMTAALEAECVARANRLNRQERGHWEPLVAVDPMRARWHGRPALDGLLRRVGLHDGGPGLQGRVVAGVEQLLSASRRAQRLLQAGDVIHIAVADRPLTSRLLCVALVAQATSPHRWACGLSTPVIPAPVDPDSGEVAPWPLRPSTRAGALTAPGARVHRWAATGPLLAAASPAGPPVGPVSSGGIRPDEALKLIAPFLDRTAGARWLGVEGRAADQFTQAIVSLLQRAGLPPAKRVPGPPAVAFLFEHGDAAIAEGDARAALPAFAQRLLGACSRRSRLYLLTDVLRTQFAAISPRRRGDPATAEAAGWMQAIEQHFLEQDYSRAVHRSVPPSHAQHWLAHTTPAPAVTPRSPAPLAPARWIAQLTPAQAAAALPVLHGHAATTSVVALLASADDADPADGPEALPQLRAHELLWDWLLSEAGGRRMAERLRRVADTTPALPPLQPTSAPLVADDALALLRAAVMHGLAPATRAALPDHIAQARTAPSPLLSLAIQLQHLQPELSAPQCARHAAVLLCPAVAGPAPVMPALTFPLPQDDIAVARTSGATDSVEGLLQRSGLAFIHALHPRLGPAQRWALLAQTHAFIATAEALRPPTVPPSAVAHQHVIAAHLLAHIAAGTDSTVRAALSGPATAERSMGDIRAWLYRLLPATRSTVARDQLFWLWMRQLQRPEWTVTDVPDWLDYGRSLQSVSFLQGVNLLEALHPGTSADAGFSTLLQLPARLASGADAADWSVPWLHALARPARLYARAHRQDDAAPDHDDDDGAELHAALQRVRTRQAELAAAADQLRRPAPQRRVLAERQLRQAGIDPRYDSLPIAAIPTAYQRQAGIRPCADPLVQENGMVAYFADAADALEAALAPDTLRDLLVAGVYEIAGYPSIARLFEQDFALYRQQMTQALAVLFARALDMLPPQDLALLRTAGLTALRTPDGGAGIILRCLPTAPAGGAGEPVYLAVVPSAGHAIRLAAGDRFDGSHWRSGLLYDAESFRQGWVSDALPPEQMALLDLPRCTAATPLPDAPRDLERVARYLAESLYGDFFARVRAAELARRTGREALWARERAFAEALAEIAVPFYGCIRDMLRADHSAAAVAGCIADIGFSVMPFGRFLRCTTTLAVRIGELEVGALLREGGAALYQLGVDLGQQSGLALVRDLGQGVVHLGTQARPLLRMLRDTPALRALADDVAAAARRSEAFEVGKALPVEGGGGLVGDAARCRRQAGMRACTGEAVELFDFNAAPDYARPGDVGWFAGLRVQAEAARGEEALFIVDGRYWQRTETERGFGYRARRDLAAPAPAGRIRATIAGGESQLVRIELHDPYPGMALRITQGGIIGQTTQGRRVLITRMAPGRFYVGALPSATAEAGTAVELRPLELEGFSEPQNDAVKRAWWGAFHYAQQCQLSGAARVDGFGSQLQRQLQMLEGLGDEIEDVRSTSPYRFETLPEQALMSCAQSNCRYVEALREEIGAAHWRAPASTDRWLDDALRDVLTPPLPEAAGDLPPRPVYGGLGGTLETRFLQPRRGPAKTLGLLRLTLKDNAPTRVFYAASGQRTGRSLLAIANLDGRHLPPGWSVHGREVHTPGTWYIDAQPSRASIASGAVADGAPHHSLHVEDVDGALVEERNARGFDAERNLQYRVERYLREGRLDPAQVERVQWFSSRPVCASCHVSVGSLRARFPGVPFEVLERAPPPPLDNPGLPHP